MLKDPGSNGTMHNIRRYVSTLGEVGKVHASHDLQIMHDKSAGERSPPILEARSSVQEHTTSGTLRDDVSHYGSVVSEGLCSVAEVFDYAPCFPGHCLSAIPKTTFYLSSRRIYTSAEKELVCLEETLHD
jgi:hypothetical protein